MLYSQDYDNVTCPASLGGIDGSHLDGSSVRWPNLLLPYHRSTALHRCPDSELRFVPPSKEHLISYEDGAYAINQAYALNKEINGQPATCPTGQPEQVISVPAETIQLSDGGGYMSFLWGGLSDRDTPRIYQSNPPMLGTADLTNDGQYSRYAVNARHNGGAEFVFCDGHAKWRPLASVARVNSHGVMYYFTAEDDDSL